MDNRNSEQGLEKPSDDWIYWPLDSNEELKPLQTCTETHFRVKNESGKVLFVYWVNHTGALTPYMRLSIDESRTQVTHATHSWVITDNELKTLLVFTAGTKDMEHIVVKPVSTPLEIAVAVSKENTPPQLNGFEWLPESWQFVPVENVSELKSFSGLSSTYFKIENTLTTPVNLFWLNYEGEALPHWNLCPGESLEQLTYATHPWLVQSEEGKNLLLFVAGTEQQKQIRVS